MNITNNNTNYYTLIPLSIKKIIAFAMFFIFLLFMYTSIIATPSVADTKIKNLTNACVACHGPDGNSPLQIYPKLAGQHENYLYQALLAYKAIGDPNQQKDLLYSSANAQIMYTQISSLSNQDLAELASFYSKQKTSNGETNPQFYELGKKLYWGGDLDKKIPACAACHGPAGQGNYYAKFPKLSGQNSEYVKSQLMAFKNDERINEMMQIVSKKLTDQEIEAVSNFISGLSQP